MLVSRFYRSKVHVKDLNNCIFFVVKHYYASARNCDEDSTDTWGTTRTLESQVLGLVSNPHFIIHFPTMKNVLVVVLLRDQQLTTFASTSAFAFDI